MSRIKNNLLVYALFFFLEGPFFFSLRVYFQRLVLMSQSHVKNHPPCQSALFLTGDLSSEWLPAAVCWEVPPRARPRAPRRSRPCSALCDFSTTAAPQFPQLGIKPPAADRAHQPGRANRWQTAAFPREPSRWFDPKGQAKSVSTSCSANNVSVLLLRRHSLSLGSSTPRLCHRY